MKKLTLILMFAAFVPMFANAQDGAQLYLDMLPEKIEILPGVYEFYGKEYTQNPDGTLKFVANKYALTVNKALADSALKHLKKNEMVFLHGPFLEQLVQEKCIRDYAEVRTAIEKTARQKVSDAESTLKAIKATDHKARKVARQELKTAEAELLLEQQNTVKNLAVLQKIVQRKGSGAIYIYNWQPMLITQPNNGGQQQNQNNNTEQNNNNKGGSTNLNDLLNNY